MFDNLNRSQQVAKYNPLCFPAIDAEQRHPSSVIEFGELLEAVRSHSRFDFGCEGGAVEGRWLDLSNCFGEGGCAGFWDRGVDALKNFFDGCCALEEDARSCEGLAFRGSHGEYWSHCFEIVDRCPAVHSLSLGASGSHSFLYQREGMISYRLSGEPDLFVISFVSIE